MDKKLRAVIIIIMMAIFIYMMLDRWQESVTIYASGCETASGTQLPTSVCRAIMKYRYQYGD